MTLLQPLLKVLSRARQMGHLHRSRCVPLATTSFSPLFCVISGVWSVLFFFVASKVTCQKMKTVWMMPWLCAVLRIILKVAISVFHNHGFSLSAVTQFASISALLLIFFFHRTPHHPTPIRASDVFGQDGEQRKWLSSALFFLFLPPHAMKEEIEHKGSAAPPCSRQCTTIYGVCCKKSHISPPPQVEVYVYVRGVCTPQPLQNITSECVL